MRVQTQQNNGLSLSLGITETPLRLFEHGWSLLKSDHISTCGQEQTWITGMPGDKQSPRVMFFYVSCCQFRFRGGMTFTKTKVLFYYNGKTIIYQIKAEQTAVVMHDTDSCCYWEFFIRITLLRVGWETMWISGLFKLPPHKMSFFSCQFLDVT